MLEEAISVGFNRVEGSSQMCTNGSVIVVIESNTRIKPGFDGRKKAFGDVDAVNCHSRVVLCSRNGVCLCLALWGLVALNRFWNSHRPLTLPEHYHYYPPENNPKFYITRLQVVRNGKSVERRRNYPYRARGLLHSSLKTFSPHFHLWNFQISRRHRMIILACVIPVTSSLSCLSIDEHALLKVPMGGPNIRPFFTQVFEFPPAVSNSSDGAVYT